MKQNILYYIKKYKIKTILKISLVILLLILVRQSCKKLPKSEQVISKKEIVKKQDSLKKEDIILDKKIEITEKKETSIKKQYEKSKDALKNEIKTIEVPYYIHDIDTIFTPVDTSGIIESYKKVIDKSNDFIIKADSLIETKDTIISLLNQKVIVKEGELKAKDIQIFGLEEDKKRQKAIIKRKNARIWLHKVIIGGVLYYIVKKKL